MYISFRKWRILGKDISEPQLYISIILLVLNFDISGKDDKDYLTHISNIISIPFR